MPTGDGKRENASKKKPPEFRGAFLLANPVISDVVF